MSIGPVNFMLEMIPEEELIIFFSLNKTQISCIDEPLTFLNQLRDNNLVPDDLYQKVIKMRTKERTQGGVYQILESLEKRGGQHVKQFWKSVFQDHILKKYSALRLLQTKFIDGSFRCHDNLFDAQKLIGSENKETGGTKRKKGADETEEGEEGPSFMSSPSPKKPATQRIILEPTGSHHSSRSTLCAEDPLDQIKDGACFLCNEEGTLVHCTNCPRAFHVRCHLPMLQDSSPGVNWMCTFCKLKIKQQSQTQRRRDEFLNSDVPAKMMDCRYLLMCMYKVDEMNVFTGNPTTTDAEWSSVISEPMWLDKVKSKLQDDKYRTVQEFVRDINLIFNNCQIVHKENDFGIMGARLKGIFEKELQNLI